MMSLFNIHFDLSVVVVISLICTGIHTLFLPGFLLEKVGHKLQEWVKYEIILKPVFLCLPCMASLWTILITWKVNFALMLCVCGLNTIIDCVISIISNQELPVSGTDNH